MTTHAHSTIDPAETPEALVALALDLKGRLERESVELKAVEAKIIALGAGKHGPEGGSVTVVAAVEASPGHVAYALPADGLERAKELAGAEFGEVFDRVVTFAPVQGFEFIVPKLLTPAKARDLLALCATMVGASGGKRAYVKYK